MRSARTFLRNRFRIPAGPAAVVVGLALAVGALPQYAPQAAAAPGLTRPATQTDLDDPVDGKNVKAKKSTLKDQAKKAAVTGAATTHWPAAASDDVAVGGTAKSAGSGRKARGVRAAGTPVTVAATGTTAPDSVEVSVLPHARATDAGIDGTLLTVTRSDGGTTSAPVQVTLDYSDFADAYGGGYGARLHLVQYPECVLTTPEKAACAKPAPLRGSNDTAARTVTAEAPAAPDTAGTEAQLVRDAGSAAASGVTVLAAVASDSGGQGDFGATSLSPSASWSVSNSSGAFNWSYPISGPPVPGGLTPSVNLSYNSQSVDGQTAATNNQGSWIGEGFGYEPGYIERGYKACADDGHDDANADQCWGTDNATIQLAGGSSGELIKDDTTGQWHVASDDFSKVEHLTGAVNGDNDGEYWKITTADGTQYYFGMNRLTGWATGDTETDSTWTVPVYGDDSGEPCYNSTFANAYCTQAWRWNLDYVVDAHGNAMSYYYGTETNYYTQGLKTTENGKAYIRGGYLKRVEYGQRAGAVYDSAAPARVVFTTAERCVGDLTDCSADALKDSTAADWPDVPWDRNCAAGTKCEGQNSPTFWTRKMLTQITTQVRSGATTYEDVDSYALNHTFTDNGDGSRSLWLSSVKHTGLVGDDLTSPSVDLSGIQLANRVDESGDNIQPFYRYRLSGVESESGSTLSVNYAAQDCSASDLPDPGESTSRCYPVKWNPPGEEDPITDWFHKYVVASVIEGDLVGDAPDQVTSYKYLGDAGWRKNKANGLTKSEYLTWGDWRGYGKVDVTTSDGTNDPSNEKTEHVFFRGLDGDTDPDGGTRTATVTDSTGTSYADSDWKSGFELETITYDGDDVVTKSVTTPWTAVTATHTADWGTRTARFVQQQTATTYTALSSGGWRTTQSTTTYDATTGRATQVNDAGELNVADNQCTRTQYADNPDKHLYSLVARTETVDVDCSVTPDRTQDVVSDDVTLYDNTTTVGAAPTKGDATTTRRLASYSTAGVATYQTVATSTFDAYGRPLKVTDAGGNPNTLAYTETNGLTTGRTETNALGWTTSVEYAPEWGQPTGQVDANGKRTDMAYDGMGRLVSVWLPGRSKSAGLTPSIKYSYGVSKTAPAWTRTQKIENGGTTYGSEYTLYDGLLRPRQVQTEGQDGGRIVADTYYDGSGRVVKTNSDYWTTGAPGTAIFEPVNADVDAQTVTEFDGAGRTTASVFKVAGVEKNRTTYTYGGDRVTVDPPTGETPTTTITDARDRTTELRQYKSDTPSPSGTSADYVATDYTYEPDGQLATVKDAAGNTWTYDYDQRGRKKTSTDPDTGSTSYKYDDLDQLTSTTDSRGKTTTSVYDALGRVTAAWDGAADTGTKLSVTKYDTVAKGELYGTYTYKGGAVVASTLNTVLDDDYQPTTTKYTIAASVQSSLAGTYTFNTQYNDDGTVQGVNYPAAGGLPAESVTYQYDGLQRLTGVNSSLGGLKYVSDVDYSPTNQVEQVALSTGTAADKDAWLTYDYEQGTNRLTRSRVDVEGAASVAYDARYTYDDAGNIRSIADNPTGGTPDTQCFAYDGLRRTTDAWTASGTSNGASGTGATDAACSSAASASTVGGVSPYWYSYTYDVTGNRKTETDHGIAGAASSSTSYVYGENGAGPHQLTSTVTDTTATSSTPAVKSANSYTYDATGNTDTRVLDGDTQNLDWDDQGDLTKVTNADGTTTSYTYDASGSRLLSQSPDETTLYLPDMELHLAAGSSTVTGTRYYSVGDQTVAVRDNDGVTFLANDQNGTAQLTVTPSTGATQRRRLDLFGEARDAASTTTGNWVDDKGYAGGTVQASTGLTTLGAREYDPTTGRFISPDPVIDYTDPQQINGYAYANNSPVTFNDASGLRLADCVGGWQECGPQPPAKGFHKGAVSSTAYDNNSGTESKATKAAADAAIARSKADAAKRRAIAAAKEIAKIAMDQLGITDALDCFTTGSLGSCGATAITVISSFLGGVAGKVAAKYGLPWKWAKGTALAKRLWKVGDRLIGAVKDWFKGRKELKATEEALGEVCSIKNSFTPDTRVLMADGSTKRIADVKIGDKVRATDPETGETKTETVTAEIKGQGLKHLVRVTIDTDGAKGTKTASITATDGHPFWVADLGEWLDATDLKPGEWLRTSAGTFVQVTAVQRWTAGDATVHNLTVSELHTYYVLAGATPVLVHNCNTGGLSLSGARHVSGRFPKTANPGETLFRQKEDGTVTAYARYDEEGAISQRADLDPDSAPHAGIPAPHILDMAKHVNPKTGQVFRNWEKMPRPLRPEEELCGCR
ncbi:polymorphic toxin-type HINT domain-containing protein [Streptomyces sp. NPDC008150]|uniref:polymorphic toxin-type HINT domain-containing protein n=1 Tax=Streptomyces sp. NPDC008150 TaxID=3364816 RepID=UPI0036E287F0